LREFFEVWGGSPDLQLPGVWFHWVNTAMMLSAWRKVGFAGGRIDKSLIDRTHFIDRVDISESPSPSKGTRLASRSIEDVVRTPDGMRSGSLAATQAKLKALMEHAEEQKTEFAASMIEEWDPETVPFLMQPKKVEQNKRDRSQVDMEVYEGGDCSLRNINDKFKDKRSKKKDKADGVAERKEARAELKSAAQQEADDVLALWALCGERCACGEDPCPMAGMQHCATCQAVKKHACKVRACVQARKDSAPRRLTFNPEVQGAQVPAAIME
jgi:hypothetical protein